MYTLQFPRGVNIIAISITQSLKENANINITVPPSNCIGRRKAPISHRKYGYMVGTNWYAEDFFLFFHK